MYEKYFGLREQPFGVTPDPRSWKFPNAPRARERSSETDFKGPSSGSTQTQ